MFSLHENRQIAPVGRSCRWPGLALLATRLNQAGALQRVPGRAERRACSIWAMTCRANSTVAASYRGGLAEKLQRGKGFTGDPFGRACDHFGNVLLTSRQLK
jgi:hypothetical protein